MYIKIFLRSCWEYILVNILSFFLNIFVFSIFWNIFAATIITITIYLGFLIVLLYDSYENLICLLYGARPLKTKKEKAYLEPIFNEICEKDYFLKGKLRLYIVNDFSINAYAIGRKTVAITKGAINGFSKDQLKGIIAHEIGHIRYGHTMAAFLSTFGNGIFYVVSILFKLLIKLSENDDGYKEIPFLRGKQ